MSFYGSVIKSVIVVAEQGTVCTFLRSAFETLG